MASLREFSRVMGVGLLSVQVAIKNGNITAFSMKGNPKKPIYDVDVEKAKEQWLDYTSRARRQTRGERDGVGVMGGQDIPEKYKKKPGRPAQQSAPSEPVPETVYQKARGTRELLTAKLLQQKFLLESRALVPVENVKKLFFEIAKTVQQNLLNIPARISPIIAAELDEKVVHDMIESEIIKALEVLSDGALESLTR